jgi:hypothetical protein
MKPNRFGEDSLLFVLEEGKKNQVVLMAEGVISDHVIIADNALVLAEGLCSLA